MFSRRGFERPYGNLGASQYESRVLQAPRIANPDPVTEIPMQLRIPLFAPCDTDTEGISTWKSISYNILNTASTAGTEDGSSTLSYNPGLIYDNKSPFDKGLYTQPNNTYITLTTDTSNPLLASLVMLGDMYAYWSISPVIDMDVSFLTAEQTACVLWSASARGWRTSFITGQAITGQADAYGVMDAGNSVARADFSRIKDRCNRTVFSELSCHSNTQSTGAQTDSATCKAHNMDEDGPSFYFSIQGLKNSEITTKTSEPIGYINMYFKVKFWKYIPGVATTNYITWRDNGYAVSESGETGDSVGAANNSELGTDTSEDSNVEAPTLSYTRPTGKGVMSVRKGPMYARRPKEKIWHSSNIWKCALTKAYNAIPESVRSFKGAANSSSTDIVFGSGDGDCRFGSKSDTYITHIKGWLGGGYNYNGDRVKAYDQNNTNVFTSDTESDSWGCATPPTCSMLETDISVSSTSTGIVTGFNSAFKVPDDNLACITGNSNTSYTQLASSSHTAAVYMPFVTTSGFTDSSSNLRPTWYFSHDIIFPNTAVQKGEQSIAMGVDTGDDVDTSVGTEDCDTADDSEECVRSIPIAILNSVPVAVPDFIRQSKDVNFIRHYIKSARREKVGSFLSFLGKVAKAAVKTVASVLDEEPCGLNGVGAKALYSVSSGNSSSSTSAVRSSNGKGQQKQKQQPRVGDSSTGSRYIEQQTATFSGSGSSTTVACSGVVTQSATNPASVTSASSGITTLITENFPHWRAAKFKVTQPTSAPGQFAKFSVKFNFAADATLFCSNLCGVYVDATNSGKFCWQANGSSISTVTMQQARPNVICCVYPVIIASLLPPTDANHVKYSVILNSPKDSYMELSPVSSDYVTNDQLTYLKLSGTEAGASAAYVPVQTTALNVSTYFEQDQTLALPDKLPNSSGTLQTVEKGTKVFFDCVLHIELRSDLPFSTAMQQASSYGSETNNYKWQYMNSAGSVTDVAPSTLQGAGYLVGICTGNDNILYADGSTATSELTKCFSVTNFSFSYQFSKPLDDIKTS